MTYVCDMERGIISAGIEEEFKLPTGVTKKWQQSPRRESGRRCRVLPDRRPYRRGRTSPASRG